MTTAAQWREGFPEIDWDDPIEVVVLRKEGMTESVLACRFCLSDIPLKAERVDQLLVFTQAEDFIEHMTVRHGG